MLLNQLFESVKANAAFAFGRFNPPHKGHVAVWETVAKSGAEWFIGTNPGTSGPKDPLPYDVKTAWMTAIDPNVKGHIMPETSVLTLAVSIYKHLGERQGLTIAYITDDQDWAWSGKLLNDYNGKEATHGYYNFAKIIHVPSPRVSSATALRDAARAGDMKAFYAAAGTDPNLEVGGKHYYDTVVDYLAQHPEKVKKPKKVVEPVTQEDAAGVGVIASKKQANDPRYSMSLTKDVRPGQVKKSLNAFKLEAMLPDKAFAGSDKNKLGPKAHLKGKMKRPARQGDLVGEDSVEQEHIVKVKGGYELKSKHGNKNLGKYPTRAGAEKRERQVQYFKHAGEDIEESKQKSASRKTVNNCVKIGEGWEQQISGLISLLETKQLNELMSYASNKGYEATGTYKRYDVFVSRKKFNNIVFISVAENPRDKRVVHKGQGATKDAALADLQAKIDKEIDVATKVSGQATLDFNVDFVREILEMSSDRFYAKIIPGPKLVIAGKEMEQYPEIMSSEGFKGSAIRNVRDTEGTTKLPGIPLSSKTAAATNLIANGRYVLGAETIDKDGNRVFDLEFDSVVTDKGERMRMRAPALTVGTNR
jgi:hypothetical protein